MKKPAPKVVRVVCDTCGLGWEDHKTASLTECVRLLKAALASRPLMTYTQGSIGTAIPTVTIN